MAGPLPIPYTEIKAYAELTGYDLEPWEVDAVRLMDKAFIEDVGKLLNKGQK